MFDVAEERGSSQTCLGDAIAELDLVLGGTQQNHRLFLMREVIALEVSYLQGVLWLLV